MRVKIKLLYVVLQGLELTEQLGNRASETQQKFSSFSGFLILYFQAGTKKGGRGLTNVSLNVI